jgi:archaemetzincin
MFPALVLALRVCLIPVGPHDAALVDKARKGIEFLYGLPVATLQAIPLPESAWYAPRKRYRAEKILAHLDAEVVPGAPCERVIALTSVDISTTKGKRTDWGILGLASLGGPSGVVSSFRVGLTPARRRAMRFVKVVNHELGHALGLDHGGAPGCIMNDAAGTVKTVDRETGVFCDEERRSLEKINALTIPRRQVFDWDAVIGR